ncbi:bifunctional adenosylcobinamide kinase/adenosylcobinamide-phosphate guanylyltransferase [Uliginosibacterium sp. H1]|uniref:bifunctional adenosylcobinamide kinase/adenosylcobinamide-phosphate guanylyltransferase n=1 Tax=Uliginosibacterium sp. H1 TaxID=3114757 RepID=UPI002E16FDB2|nr:bifunctional adenosylcobinamide kinase/adenosylcobinamide-phosphate guanylyltransferase [Uliginosibacterium sp. H1]
MSLIAPIQQTQRTLVIGGARSGKSGHAQNAAIASGLPVTLIVTAEIRDAEMQARVDRHRAERPASWTVIEAADSLPGALREHVRPGRAVLVDCVTLWLSRLLCDAPDELEAGCDALVAAVRDAQGSLWLVSNEVGWSLVPEHPLGRRFRDEQGRLNQRLASVCDSVVLVAAGLPLMLKQPA